MLERSCSTVRCARDDRRNVLDCGRTTRARAGPCRTPVSSATSFTCRRLGVAALRQSGTAGAIRSRGASARLPAGAPSRYLPDKKARCEWAPGGQARDRYPRTSGRTRCSNAAGGRAGCTEAVRPPVCRRWWRSAISQAARISVSRPFGRTPIKRLVRRSTISLMAQTVSSIGVVGSDRWQKTISTKSSPQPLQENHPWPTPGTCGSRCCAC